LLSTVIFAALVNEENIPFVLFKNATTGYDGEEKTTGNCAATAFLNLHVVLRVKKVCESIY
jgi:hypothetical protein